MNHVTNTIEVLDGCIKFIDRITTDKGMVRLSHHINYDGKEKTLDLKGVWRTLYGNGTDPDEVTAESLDGVFSRSGVPEHLGYLLAATRKDALNAAVYDYLYNDKGAKDSVARYIASNYPASLHDLKESLKNGKGGASPSITAIMGVPLDDNFRRVLDWHIDSCKYRTVVINDISTAVNSLSEVYAKLQLSSEDSHPELLNEIRLIDSDVRTMGDPTTKSIRGHLDRISTMLWVQTGQVVPSAREAIARRVLRVACSIINDDIYGRSISMYRDIVMNVESMCRPEGYIDTPRIGAMVPLVKSMMDMLDDISRARGDLSIMFMLAGVSVDEMFKAKTGMMSLLDALKTGSIIIVGNGKVEKMPVNSYGGTSTPAHQGESTVATMPQTASRPAPEKASVGKGMFNELIGK